MANSLSQTSTIRGASRLWNCTHSESVSMLACVELSLASFSVSEAGLKAMARPGYDMVIEERRQLPLQRSESRNKDGSVLVLHRGRCAEGVQIEALNSLEADVAAAAADSTS